MTTGASRLRISIAEIAIGERIGFYNADHAAQLGASMAAEGQRAPIQVKRNGPAAKLRWTLVAGLHRIRGAELADWSEIDAIQVADKSASPTDLRRLELAENLSHRFRRPIERAIMMAAQARLEEEIDHPGMVGESSQARGARITNSAAVTMKVARASVAMTEARDAHDTMSQASKIEQPRDTSGQAVRPYAPDSLSGASIRATSCRTYNAEEHAPAKIAEAYDWRERTAKAFGCSLSSFERHRRLHRAIVEAMPDLAQSINDHPLGESFSAMMTLSQILQPDARRQAAELLLSSKDWENMTAVLVKANLQGKNSNRATPEAKLKEIWSGLSPLQKRSHFVTMAWDIPPSLVRETIDELSKRLP